MYKSAPSECLKYFQRLKYRSIKHLNAGEFPLVLGKEFFPHFSAEMSVRKVSFVSRFYIRLSRRRSRSGGRLWKLEGGPEGSGTKGRMDAARGGREGSGGVGRREMGPSTEDVTRTTTDGDS